MLRKTIGIFLLALSALSGMAFYFQYFKWRDCFNELGRCFDAEAGATYLEQSGLVYAGLAASFLGISLVLLIRRSPRS